MQSPDAEIKIQNQSQTTVKQNSGTGRKKVWVYVIILIVLAAVLCYAAVVLKQHPKNSAPRSADQTFSQLLAGDTITFGQVKSSIVIAAGTVPAQVSLFLNPYAKDFKLVLVHYQDLTTSGFLGSYTAPSTSASVLYQTNLAAAKKAGWTLLYGASSSQAAVLEAQDQIKTTLYKVRVTYQNQPGGSVTVSAQYMLTNQK